jgi:hypothetical protein
MTVEVEALQNQQKRLARWRILRALYIGMPVHVSETLLGQILNDANLEITLRELRAALLYLAGDGKKYVTLNAPKHGIWTATLTPAGVDWLENPNAEDPGIARPEV